jgi:RNA polymerase sigma-70 factor (ECF subfamily)
MDDDAPHLHQQFLRAFTLHEPAIRAFVRRLVPARADADDVLQETAIVLWEKFGEFRPGGDFRAWACGIARFKVLAWLRDRGRRRLVLADDVVEALADEAAEHESLLDRQRAALEACFAKLPPDDRELLARAYQPETKIHEVAATSGRTVGGFYQWLHRLRRLLLDCIERELTRESIA